MCLQFLYSILTLSFIPHTIKVAFLVVLYLYSLFYIVFSISFVSGSNTNTINTFPVDCKNFGKKDDSSFCSLVYFDYCNSYKSLINNYTNEFDPADVEQSFLSDLDLQSLQVFF